MVALARLVGVAVERALGGFPGGAVVAFDGAHRVDEELERLGRAAYAGHCLGRRRGRAAGGLEAQRRRVERLGRRAEELMAVLDVARRAEPARQRRLGGQVFQVGLSGGPGHDGGRVPVLGGGQATVGPVAGGAARRGVGALGRLEPLLGEGADGRRERLHLGPRRRLLTLGLLEPGAQVGADLDQVVGVRGHPVRLAQHVDRFARRRVVHRHRAAAGYVAQVGAGEFGGARVAVGGALVLGRLVTAGRGELAGGRGPLALQGDLVAGPRGGECPLGNARLLQCEGGEALLALRRGPYRRTQRREPQPELGSPRREPAERVGPVADRRRRRRVRVGGALAAGLQFEEAPGRELLPPGLELAQEAVVGGQVRLEAGEALQPLDVPLVDRGLHDGGRVEVVHRRVQRHDEVHSGQRSRQRSRGQLRGHAERGGRADADERGRQEPPVREDLLARVASWAGSLSRTPVASSGTRWQISRRCATSSMVAR